MPILARVARVWATQELALHGPHECSPRFFEVSRAWGFGEYLTCEPREGPLCESLAIPLQLYSVAGKYKLFAAWTQQTYLNSFPGYWWNLRAVGYSVQRDLNCLAINLLHAKISWARDDTRGSCVSVYNEFYISLSSSGSRMGLLLKKNELFTGGGPCSMGTWFLCVITIWSRNQMTMSFFNHVKGTPSRTLHSGQTQKATSHPVFQSLEVWISSKIYEREVRMKTMQNKQQTEFHAGKTCAWQLIHYST